MAITHGLVRALEQAALEEAAALKSRYVGRIQAVLEAVEPALSPLELSVALGVDAPDKTRSVVSRWLSASPRNLKAVPDEALRALFDRLVEGQAVMAVGPALQTASGASLRQLTFCEDWEAARLGEHWQVVRLGVSGGVELTRAAGDGGNAMFDWSGGASSPTGPTGPATRATATTTVSGAARAEVVRFDPARPLAFPPRQVARGVMVPPLGLGAMRLSTGSKLGDGSVKRPEEAEAVAVIRRAIELGVRLVDTADSYALDDRDMHHNERLIRRALEGLGRELASEVIVATKAGLVRPGGRWAPNGRPEHLVRACEASLQALGIEALALFQLHVKDPRVPWEDSLGALAELYRQGKVRRLGVCNVNTRDLATALRVLPEGSLVSVQNELNPFDTASARGVLAMTRVQGLSLLAHSPLGGHAGVHRVLKKDVLAQIALKHGRGGDESGRHQVVLAWLLSLGPHVIPIFGATRRLSVESSLAALQLELDAEDLAAIDQAFPKAAALRDEAPPVIDGGAPGGAVAIEIGESAPLPPPGQAPEVVVILGIPGAGKSSLAEPYVEAGYVRLNRDELGGKLDDLVPHLRAALGSGQRRVVLDNTYPTRRTRALVLAAARDAGVPVRCLWLDTSLADARHNAVLRMLHRHGRLLSPDEIALFSKTEANTIPPLAQAIWLKNFEAPSVAEGFDQVERRRFVRAARPDRTQKALLLDVDGTLRVTRSGGKYPRDPSDLELQPRRREVLLRHHDEGYRLFFVSNQSAISSGKTTRAVVEAAFARTIELLGLPVDEVAYCPHQAFPIACFCRKPMPGLAVMLIEKHALSLPDLIVVGDMQSDADLAAGIGARYVDAEDFFGPT